MNAKIYFKTCLIAFMIVAFFALSTPSAYSAVASITGSTLKFSQEEVQAQHTLGDYILNLAEQAGYKTQDARVGYEKFCCAVEGCGEPYSIVFHCSHGGLDEALGHWRWILTPIGPLPIWCPHSQYRIFQDHEVVGVYGMYDDFIYNWSTSHKLKFAFIYTCHSADVMGYFKKYSCGEVHPFGMPFAWLHTNQLSTDGYKNPDGHGLCYIGFEGAGPNLTFNFTINGQTIEWACYNFVQKFFYATLQLKFTVNQALDYAARLIFKKVGVEYFSQCVLYTGYVVKEPGRMRVYGDGTIQLVSIGDLNHDHSVDVTDVNMVYQAIETQDLQYDFNADGEVDLEDVRLEYKCLIERYAIDFTRQLSKNIEYYDFENKRIIKRWTNAPPIEQTTSIFGQTINVLANNIS
ncbi:MAG: hypothetical protein QXI91_04435 [Candidatus Bathyarchaeia archaeon]